MFALELAGVELAREQELVDDVRETVGLLGDHVEQLVVQLRLELDIVAPERQRRAVDRGERRAQLVRHGRDEVLPHRLERPLVGEVAERVDRSVLVPHRGDGEPELALLELQRDALRARRLAGARDGDALLDFRPAGNRGRRRACRARRSSSRPVIHCAALFQSWIRPRWSTRKTPSPIVASTRAACARASASRYRRAFSIAVAARRASSSARLRSSAPKRRPDSDATSVIAPSTASLPLQRHAHVRREPELLQELEVELVPGRGREHLLRDLGHELRLARADHGGRAGRRSRQSAG